MRERPVFDDAHWHWNGNYPPDLLPRDEQDDPLPVAHIAFFLVWAIERGLACAEHADRTVPEVRQLADRSITPWEYMTDRIGCRLEDGDFNEQGLAFTRAYYGKRRATFYLDDFCLVFDEAETGYHVADTWANYDRLKPLLDRAWAYWQEEGSLDGWADEARLWWHAHTSAERGDDEEAKPGAAPDPAT